jgi:hypothetical protein
VRRAALGVLLMLSACAARADIEHYSVFFDGVEGGHVTADTSGGRTRIDFDF